MSFSWTTGKSKALKIEIEDLHNENSTHEETMKLHDICRNGVQASI